MIVMQCRIRLAIGRLDADEEEAARGLFQVVGEIFAAHAVAGDGDEVVGAEGFSRDVADVIGHLRVVDRWRIARDPIEGVMAAICGGDAGAAAVDSGTDLLAAVTMDRAGGAGDGCGVGDDVGGRAGVERADGDDRRIGRVKLPAGELLKFSTASAAVTIGSMPMCGKAP